MDWLVNWYFVQENGVAVHGPSARTFLDPIAKQEFLNAIRDHAMQWCEYVNNTRNSRPYQAYAILTMCRAIYTLRHGEQVSKSKAAAWAQQQMPGWSALIANALLWRRDRRSPADPKDTFPDTACFVQYIVDLIERS